METILIIISSVIIIICLGCAIKIIIEAIKGRIN